MLNNTIDLISKFIENHHPKYYVGFIVTLFILYIIGKVTKYSIDFYKYYVSQEREKLKKFINLQELNKNPQMHDLIQDKIDSLIFYQCSGILSNKEEREVIISIAKAYNIELIHFKRAYRLYKIENGKLNIEIPLWEKIEKYIVYSLSFFAFIVGVMCIVLATLSTLDWVRMLFFYIISIILLFAAVIVLTQNWKFVSARLIEEKMEVN